MTGQTQAALALERFGGFPAMAKKTGVPEQTIRNWVREGMIPQKNHLIVLRGAQRHGVNFMPHDLVAHLVTALIADAQSGDSTTPAQ